jgi:hypothetical protein
MNCTSLNFGTSNLNSTSSRQTVQCQANTPLLVAAVALTGNPNFLLSGLPVLPLSVAAGNKFSFQATFAPTSVGPLSSSVIVNTTQPVSGYSINTPIPLKGIAQNQDPPLKITSITVSFSGIITGQQPGGVNQSVIFSNLGNANAVITSIQHSTSLRNRPLDLVELYCRRRHDRTIHFYCTACNDSRKRRINCHDQLQSSNER